MRKTDRERTPERWYKLLEERNSEAAQLRAENKRFNRWALAAEDKLTETEERLEVLEKGIEVQAALVTTAQVDRDFASGRASGLAEALDKVLGAIEKEDDA